DPPAEPGFRPGQRIRNRYVIVSEYRSDRTAFAAQDLQTNRMVALRPLSLAGSYEMQQLSELREEISLLHELSHPNLAALIALESADCGLFIVSELINGFSLQEMLRARRHPLVWSEAVQLANPLATVLDFIAERRLLMRELALSDIFVDLPASSKEWTEVQRSPVSCWPPFVLRLEAVNLGPILGATEDADDFRSSGDHGPSGELRQPGFEHEHEAGAETHPVREAAQLIYELLRGGRASDHPDSLEELSVLSESGNALLQLGIIEPGLFATAKEFLLKLEEAESAPASRPSTSGDTKRPASRRFAVTLGKEDRPAVAAMSKGTATSPEIRSVNQAIGAARRVLSIASQGRLFALLAAIVFCAVTALLAIKLLGIRIPAGANPDFVQSTTVSSKASPASPTATPAPVSAVGRLQMNSDPPGLPVEIIDGDRQVSRGVTPMVLDALPAGKYLVKMNRAGWPDYQQEVSLEADGSVTVSHAFHEVSVTLTSDPSGATISKAGAEIGKTPLTIKLPPIPVELVSKFDTLAPVTQQVVPKLDGSTVAEFKHDYGVLAVNSNRPDAHVLVGGTDLGKAPTEQDLPPGPQVVVVKAPGLPDQMQRTEIQNGQRVVLWFNFVTPSETATPVASPSPSAPQPSRNVSAAADAGGEPRPPVQERRDVQWEPPPTELPTGRQLPETNPGATPAEEQPQNESTGTETQQPETTTRKKQHRKTEHASLIPPGETYDQARREAFSRLGTHWDAKKRDLKARKDYADYQVKHSTGSIQQRYQRQLDQIKRELSQYNSERHSAEDALKKTWDNAARHGGH
ncbi:MAG TPA: PEGA domain-containing protein, partial [Chthoniobacterales bacterium]